MYTDFLENIEIDRHLFALDGICEFLISLASMLSHQSSDPTVVGTVPKDTVFWEYVVREWEI